MSHHGDNCGDSCGGDHCHCHCHSGNSSCCNDQKQGHEHGEESMEDRMKRFEERMSMMSPDDLKMKKEKLTKKLAVVEKLLKGKK